MKRLVLLGSVLVTFSLLLIASGCNKEKIVENTEYVHDTEYVQLPPDTVTLYDTIRIIDTTTSSDVDTIIVIDTVIKVTTVHDTVVVNHVIYDTVRTTVHDTVTTIHHDTVTVTSYRAGKGTAFVALQAYLDANYFSGDYVEYLSLASMAAYNSANSTTFGVTASGTNSWDVYGMLYSNAEETYYEFEMLVTYNGSGNPDNLSSWTVDESVGSAPANGAASLRPVPTPTTIQREMH
jgi:hypothetical protein